MGGPDGRGKAVIKLKITRQNKIMSTPAVRHRIKLRNHLIFDTNSRVSKYQIQNVHQINLSFSI